MKNHLLSLCFTCWLLIPQSSRAAIYILVERFSPEHRPAFGTQDSNPIATVDPGYVEYQSNVRSKIVREWIYSQIGLDEDKFLRARISVRIDAAGKVIEYALQRLSGYESFDRSAMRSIERASPLPPPPEAIKAKALSEGFVVDFNYRMLKSR